MRIISSNVKLISQGKTDMYSTLCYHRSEFITAVWGKAQGWRKGPKCAKLLSQRGL